MALRSLYTLVATAVNTLEYIKPVRPTSSPSPAPPPHPPSYTTPPNPQAVALVLAFVGIKMGLEFYHVEVPISASLGVVVSILGGGIGLSLLKQRFWPDESGNGKNGKNGKK